MQLEMAMSDYFASHAPPPLEPDPGLVRMIYPPHMPWSGSAVPLNDRKRFRIMRYGSSKPVSRPTPLRFLSRPPTRHPPYPSSF